MPQKHEDILKKRDFSIAVVKKYVIMDADESRRVATLAFDRS